MQVGYTNYTEVRVYNGWYPALYYKHTFPMGSSWDFDMYYPINYARNQIRCAHCRRSH
jgi:hypothetical protein